MRGERVVEYITRYLRGAESTVRWFVVREKYYWMAADSADKLKRTG
jgi:hypothetical protein